VVKGKVDSPWNWSTTLAGEDGWLTLKLFGALFFSQLPENVTDDELKLDTFCVRVLGSVLVMDANASKGGGEGGGGVRILHQDSGQKKGSRKQRGSALI
jgi:hypothetical protein